MRIVLTVLVWLVALCAPLSAQVHPCDEPDSGTGRTTASAVRVGFCHQGLDTQGRPAPLTGASVVVDGGAAVDLNIGAPSATANATGHRYYESQAEIPLTVGNHTLVVSVRNASGSASSPVFALVVEVAGPGAPIKIRVVEVRPPGDVD